MPRMMLRKIGIINGILIVGIVVGLFILALGMIGPLYRSQVVILPVNLQSPSEHETTFTVDRSEEYMVEIHLDSVFSEEKMDTILGDFVAGGGGAIDVSWVIKDNEVVIAQGSNTKYGYSPIWGGGRSGLAIGTVSADKGKEYSLFVFTKNTSSDWNLAKPYVEVGLHPSKLESYLVLQLFGILIMSVFGVTLIIAVFVGKRNMASNKAPQPTPKNGAAEL